MLTNDIQAMFWLSQEVGSQKVWQIKHHSSVQERQGRDEVQRKFDVKTNTNISEPIWIGSYVVQP